MARCKGKVGICMDKETLEAIRVVSAIAGLTILETIARMQGIDGAILGLVMAIIGGIGGYSVNKLIPKK